MSLRTYKSILLPCVILPFREFHMKSVHVFLLVLFLGSMTLLAQDSGRNDTQSSVAKVAVPGLSCPVTMAAQWQRSQGAPTFVNGQHNQTARKMRLIIKNPKITDVVGLKITAHGLNSKPKISPAQAASSDSSDISKTFDLKLKIEPDSEAST